MLAVVFGALLITACCAGHLILAGGGLAGFLTRSETRAAAGLVAILPGAFFLAHPAHKDKDK